jgi:lycopene cyclase domain-containing protein
VATYLILNFVVMLLALALVRPRVPWRATWWWAGLVALLLLTAVFDNLIILADIVSYDPEKLLGVYIGVAPIEDFAYSILAALIVPHLLQKKPERE